MESSFCGCDQGSLTGYHLDTKHLKNVGCDFCKALAMIKDCDEEWHIDKYGNLLLMHCHFIPCNIINEVDIVQKNEGKLLIFLL